MSEQPHYEFRTETLVRGRGGSRRGEESITSSSTFVPTEYNRMEVCPILASDTPLSFWGGIDECTGVVIDTSHPLHGCCVTDTILCLPSGRGSCTASQVLLELILNKKAPRAIVLRDRDGLVCVGALIAQVVFQIQSMDILQVSPIFESSNSFDLLIKMNPKVGSISSNGTIVIGETIEEVAERIKIHMKSATSSQSNINDGSGQDDPWSDEERSMMTNATSDAEHKAVECLIRYARIVVPQSRLNSSDCDTPVYLDVEQAHIDGCTYIGPGGLQFVQQLVRDSGRVKVPTTLNSVSTDLKHWKQLGIIPTESQQNSIALADAYVALGCSEESFTCAPYLLDSAPTKGQQIVWGESNAVVYANTVLGAKTEKYADYLDICCAIVGKVPAVGVHLEDFRKPRILLDVGELDLFAENADDFRLIFPVLGHLCGSLSDGEVPLLVGMERFQSQISSDHLKAFCAAFGTTAASPLIHIAGVTPEAFHPSDVDALKRSCQNRSKVISSQDMDFTFKLLDQQLHQDESIASLSGNQQIDWVALGNPHLSLSECTELLDLMEKQSRNTKKTEINRNVTMIACMSRNLYDQATFVAKLEEFGVTFVRDTCWCMLLHPPMIPTDPTATILTNSGKYAHYGPGLTGRKFRFGSMEECVQAAWTGHLPRRSLTTNVPWRQRKTEQRRFFSSMIGYYTRCRAFLPNTTRFLRCKL